MNGLTNLAKVVTLPAYYLIVNSNVRAYNSRWSLTFPTPAPSFQEQQRKMERDMRNWGNSIAKKK